MSEAPREAIVLVGGLGTRLRPVVSDVPKPMAPVAGRPFLAWVLDHLHDNAVDRIVLAAGYRAECLVECFGDAWRGVELRYSIEAEPLGTGGAVRLAMAETRGHGVHVLNGDTFLRYSLPEMERGACVAGGDLSMALAHVDDVARYGAVELEGARVTGFSEKGRSGPGYINAGSYYLGPRAIARLPGAERYSFETEVLRPMAAEGRVAAVTDTRDFIDIGIPEDYRRAQQVFA
ncbi:MAG: nucleotidyltransferase family protein [Luteimonas sp.]|nr:nucleotidyltransferase family protein [Luteimonas sp.]